jgi:uncharacterized protein YukE
MTTFLGADPEQLDSLARLFDSSGQTLENLRKRIGAVVYSAPWTGQDAEKFKSEWNSIHVRTLSAAATALAGSASYLRTKAREQVQASSAGTGGAGGGRSGGGGGASPGGPVATILKLVHDIHVPLQGLSWLASGIMNVPAFLRGPVISLVNKFPELRTILPGLGPLAGAVGLVYDGTTFVQDLQKYGWNAVPTMEAGFNSAADVAGMFPGPGWVISGGIHLGEFAYNLDPNWPSDAGAGANLLFHHPDQFWNTLSTDVKGGAVTAWNTTTTDIKSTAVGAWDTTTTDIKDTAGTAWHAVTGWIP